MSTYFETGFTKAQLDTAQADTTSAMGENDIIRGLRAYSEPLIQNEYYQVVYRVSGDIGWQVEDKDGNLNYYTGQPLEIYDGERGVEWEKIDLSTVQPVGNTPTTGPNNAVVQIPLPTTGPNNVTVQVPLPTTGPNNAAVQIPLPTTGPNTAVTSRIVEVVTSGPSDIDLQLLLIQITAGPESLKINKVPSKGPDFLVYTLLPATGPGRISLQDSRSIPVDEISNAPTIPDKGRGYNFDSPVKGPADIKALPAAIFVEGYYPLYKDSNTANLASPIGSHHTHDLGGVTYYMPNGLDKVWHGTFKPPVNGPRKCKLVEIAKGRTKTPKYISHIYDTRASALTGPFTYEGITAVTSRDNGSELFAVNEKHEIVKSKLNDLKDSEFNFPSHRLNVKHKFDLETEEGVVASDKGEFMYRGKFLSSPFADGLRIEGEIENPLFFKDCYLAIAETNWMHLGSEAALKELYRVDLTFAESSLGHVWLYAMNESKKVSGQYKGEIRDNMKVFTNLRGKRFKIKMFVATHKDFPWSMREMSLGYNQGKNF